MTTVTTWTQRLITGAVVVLLACLAAAPALAATGNQGYAVYRDGVAVIEWHAAIMDDPHWNTTSLPVIHTPGSSYVKWDSWTNFMGGKVYKGTYRPKTAPSSASRDSFKYMSRRLKDEQITYDSIYQVNYDSSTAGTWVDPVDVTKMRCDGVIEYVYEWYGFRVFGSDANWDVTKVGFWSKHDHSLPYVTPKIQSSYYLTKVTSSLP